MASRPVGERRPGAAAPAPEAAAVPVPADFSLALDPDTEALDGGRVLLGGSPLRLLRLTPEGGRRVAAWNAGEPVGERRGGLLARRLVRAGVVHPRPPVGPVSDQVTVVVPVHDRPGALARLLADLAGEPGLGPVLVVDDGSADPGRTAEVAAGAGATVVALEHNRGPAAARNAGAAAARTELVAFVDSDCRPRPGWLAPLVAHFADPVVAAAAPRIVPPEEGGDWRTRYETARSPLDRGAREGPVRPRSRIPFVPSAALVVRRSALEGVGFDEALRGGEDVDFVWRLAGAGWDVRYVPTSTVAHEQRADVGRWLARRAFYGATAGPLARRHPGQLMPASMSAWSAATWLLAAARRPAAAAAVAGVATAVLARRLDGVVARPVPVAARIVGLGTVRAAVPTAEGLVRAWGPAVVAALAVRRLRPVAAAALVVPALDEWRRHRPPLDPLRWVAAHVVDDLAYSVGLWIGCARARTLGPLIPEVVVRAPEWSRAGVGARTAKPA